jgi:hypothetical protein
VLIKGGKKYFMALIDDSTRYCYVYLLKSKDEALNYFKTYRAKDKINLIKIINNIGQIVVENIFPLNAIHFVWKMA